MRLYYIIYVRYNSKYSCVYLFPLNECHDSLYSECHHNHNLTVTSAVPVASLSSLTTCTQQGMKPVRPAES